MLQTYLAFFPGSLNKKVTELLVFNIARSLCYIKDSLLTDRVHSRWLEVTYVCSMVWPQVFNKHRLNIPWNVILMWQLCLLALHQGRALIFSQFFVTD